MGMCKIYSHQEREFIAFAINHFKTQDPLTTEEFTEFIDSAIANLKDLINRGLTNHIEGFFKHKESLCNTAKKKVTMPYTSKGYGIFFADRKLVIKTPGRPICYTFTETPITANDIDNIIRDIISWRKNVGVKPEKVETPEDRAISLLLSKGYKVYKPSIFITKEISDKMASLADLGFTVTQPEIEYTEISLSD